jgi:tetratricopeptide (TPR) repeat protein
MHNAIKRLFPVAALILGAAQSYAQDNCSLLKEPNRIKACKLYNASDSLAQGSIESQHLLDSALSYWPEYAEAWREKSVPYLKRGDFLTWRKYMDRAVQLRPEKFLGVRGWCRFKFLRDYEGALDDLKKFNVLTPFDPGQSGDGNYSLYVVMGLCARELGHTAEAFRYFSMGIDSAVAQKGLEWVGLYDYLHRAVTRMRVKDYTGALSDLDFQQKKYSKFAETSYYRGQTLLALGRKEEARIAFEKAKTLFVSEGYHFSDLYSEMMDEVYLEDIEEALK